MKPLTSIEQNMLGKDWSDGVSIGNTHVRRHHELYEMLIWASLIASGIKQVENRTYPVPKTVRGQRIAIHAGKGFDEWGLHALIASRCRCKAAVEPNKGWFLDSHEDCFACQLRVLEEVKEASQDVSGRILCTAVIAASINPDDGFLTVHHPKHVNIKPDLSFWEVESYAWILADVELVDDPRIHRGMLGFWEVAHD